MLEKIIVYSAISIAVTFAMSYLNKSANSKPAEPKNGITQLRMNKLYSIIGYMGIGIAIMFSIGSIFFYEPGLEILSVIIWLVMGGSGIVCLIYYINHKVQFDKDKIIISNWRGKTNTFKWNEIRDVKFRPISGYIRIEDEEKTANIHSHLIGLNMFINQLDKKTKFKKSKLKLPFK